MTTVRTTLLALLIASLTLTDARAADYSSPKGFTTSLDLGVNFLVPPTKGKEAFKEFDPSFGMELGLGYRFSNLVALRFGFTFGMYDFPDPPGASAYARFIALDIGPRFYVQAGPVDIFFDLGLGWDLFSFGASGGGVSIDTSLHALDAALGTGVEYRIMPGLSAGLGIGYHFPFYVYGCFKSAGSPEDCDTVNDQKFSRTPQDLLLAATVTVNWGKLLGGGMSSEPEIAPGGRSSLPGSGSSPAARPATKAAPAAGSAGSGSAGSAPRAPSGPGQRQLIASAFTAKTGQEPLVALGFSQDDVIDVLGMPSKMDQIGYNTRFIFPGSARGLTGFRQVVFLFNQDKALVQVEMVPSQGIDQAFIREKLGEPTKKQQSKNGVVVWYYKRHKLAYYFKPGTTRAYHVRHKVF